ncbi:hypothetical protein CEXT_131031 [Caerostris extrusa]|uniref:Uncharacterized protein n=1 Tax=Caerostris extrusa TaxID=172846 RepID=A0AAV4Y9H6_CAEEX|nr:hypothetical protein CEXT_131031 [Caerostris extrusa]
MPLRDISHIDKKSSEIEKLLKLVSHHAAAASSSERRRVIGGKARKFATQTITNIPHDFSHETNTTFFFNCSPTSLNPASRARSLAGGRISRRRIHSCRELRRNFLPTLRSERKEGVLPDSGRIVYSPPSQHALR